MVRLQLLTGKRYKSLSQLIANRATDIPRESPAVFPHPHSKDVHRARAARCPTCSWRRPTWIRNGAMPAYSRTAGTTLAVMGEWSASRGALISNRAVTSMGWLQQATMLLRPITSLGLQV